MKTYAFYVVLKGVSEVTDDHADALFASGCDDGTPASRDGLAWIHFDREAASLEVAIESAIKQVQTARLSVARIEVSVEQAAAMGL